MFDKPLSREKLNSLLSELHTRFQDLLGEKLVALYLYGSQARGDARPDSDIDVLIVLKGDFDHGEMLALTSDAAWTLSLDNDVVISRVFVSKEAFDAANTPFLANVHREAQLWGNVN